MDLERHRSRLTLNETLNNAISYGVNQRGYQRKSASSAFTLIELVITIAISTIIMAALYFSLKTALDTWGICQGELLLQQSSSRIMEELVEGPPDAYGIRDALEVIDGSPTQVSVVMPWTDE